MPYFTVTWLLSDHKDIFNIVVVRDKYNLLKLKIILSINFDIYRN